MKKPESKAIYRRIHELPVIGELLSIANAYAYKGSNKFLNNFAPMKYWWNRIFKNASYVAIFVCFLVYFSDKNIHQWEWSPADTILGAFPSVLGFGIGVYALMFIMPKDFLLFLKKGKDAGKPGAIGPEIVPVDMGYPLMAFIVTMFIAAISKVFPDNSFLTIFSLWALFYGLVMAVELMTFLFLSSMKIQSLRTKKQSKVRYLKRKRR